MPALSDEAIARAAQAAGARRATRCRAAIYCMEPASFTYEGRTVSGRFVANPGVYSQANCLPHTDRRTWGAPVCRMCRRPTRWLRPPKRVGGVWTYAITPPGHPDCLRCAGLELDFIRSPFRLVVGGTVDWWERLGWALNL